MHCTFWYRPSIILDILWFRCRSNANDASSMKVSWWKDLWKASWMHLNSKYVAFVRFVVSCVGLSFRWICVYMSCCMCVYMSCCMCVDDLHAIWCRWFGKYDWCMCWFMYFLWSELRSNLENGWRLQYGNDFDYLVRFCCKDDNPDIFSLVKFEWLVSELYTLKVEALLVKLNAGKYEDNPTYPIDQNDIMSGV